MRKLLDQSFFQRPALEVCPEIIGKYLVRKFEDREIAIMITEVEAYVGPDDQASHARFGKTKRNEVMFGPAGYWYIYLCYGMHWMLNIVVDKEDYPAAILLRGSKELVGPGRLTKYLELNKSINQKPANRVTSLWLEDRAVVVPKNSIQRTPRIGVDYAGKWAKEPYRYVLS